MKDWVDMGIKRSAHRAMPDEAFRIRAGRVLETGDNVGAHIPRQTSAVAADAAAAADPAAAAK